MLEGEFNASDRRMIQSYMDCFQKDLSFYHISLNDVPRRVLSNPFDVYKAHVQEVYSRLASYMLESPAVQIDEEADLDELFS